MPRGKYPRKATRVKSHKDWKERLGEATVRRTIAEAAAIERPPAPLGQPDINRIADEVMRRAKQEFAGSANSGPAYDTLLTADRAVTPIHPTGQPQRQSIANQLDEVLKLADLMAMQSLHIMNMVGSQAEAPTGLTQEPANPEPSTVASRLRIIATLLRTASNRNDAVLGHIAI